MEHRSGCWGGTAYAQETIRLEIVNDGDNTAAGNSRQRSAQERGRKYLVRVHRSVSQSTKANRPQVRLDQINSGLVMSRTNAQSGYKRGVACKDYEPARQGGNVPRRRDPPFRRFRTSALINYCLKYCRGEERLLVNPI